jgi:hypothetical protein
MEEYVRTFLFFGAILVLLGLGGALLFCAGLSDVIHWSACAPMLDFTTQAVHTVASLFGQ